MLLSRQQIYLIPYHLTEEIVLFFVLVVQVYYKKVKDTVVAVSQEIVGAPRLVAVAVKKKLTEYAGQAAKKVAIVKSKIRNIFNVARFSSFGSFISFYLKLVATQFKISRFNFAKNRQHTPDFVIYSNLLAPPLL